MAGELDFIVGLDTDQLRYDIAGVQNQFKRIGDNAVQEGKRIDNVFNKLGKSLAVYFSAQQIGAFAGAIVRTRGEFQQLEVAFETMLGSKEKADKLMMQVTEFAAKTPFELTDVASGTKQLMAVGVQANEVIPTLKALGDVSAGLSVPIERLILNYGQVKTQGKLMGQEMRDFMVAGVPLVAELAKNLGKSEPEIRAMVSAGRIGFKDVEKAFESMTSGAGTFADLMDKQSATITGRISNLQDSVDKMFNEIGQANEGFINSALDGAGWLIEHYQEIGDVLKVIIASYGMYKGSVIALDTFQKAQKNYKLLEEGKQLGSLIDKEKLRAAGIKNLNNLSKEQAAFIKQETQIQLDNLKVEEKKANVAFNSAKEQHKASLQNSLAAKKLVREKQAELNAIKASGDAKKIAKAQTSLLNAEEQRSIAVKNRKNTANALSTASTNKETAAKRIATFQTQIQSKTELTAARSKKILRIATQGVTRAFNSMKVAFMTNPFGFIITAITMVVTAMSLFGTETENAINVQNTLKNISKETGEEIGKQKGEIEGLVTQINNENVSRDERNEKLRELIKLAPEHLKGLTLENIATKEGTAIIDAYVEAQERKIRMDLQNKELTESISREEAIKNGTDERTKAEWYEKLGVALDFNGVFVSGIFGGGSYSDKIERIEKARKKAALEAEHKIQEKVKENMRADQEEILKKKKDEPVISFAEAKKTAKDAKNKLDELRKQAKVKGTTATLKKEIDEQEAIYKNATSVLQKYYGLKKSKSNTTSNSKKELEALQKLQKQIAEKAQQAEIDLMQEGLDKWLAEAALNYDEKKKQIEKEETELLEQKIKVEKAKHIKSGKSAETFDKSKVQLTDEEKRYFENRRKLQKKEYNKDVEDAIKRDDKLIEQQKEKLNKYKKEFETYQQKRERIAKEYDEKIKALQENNKNGEYDGNIEKAKAEKDKAIKNVDKEFAKAKESFVEWSNSLIDMTMGRLNKLLKSTRDKLNDSTLTDDDRTILQQKIIALENLIASKKAKGENDWTDALKVMNELNELVANTIENFDNLDDGTKKVLTSIVSMTGGIIGLGQSLHAVQVAFKAAGKSASFMQKSSAVLMAVNAGLKVVNAISGFFKGNKEEEKKHQKALVEIAERKVAMQNEYNRLLREQNKLMRQDNSIFGENSLKNAVNLVHTVGDIRTEYDKLIKGKDRYENDINEIDKHAGPFKGAANLQKKILQIGYQQGNYGLASMRVKTGSHTEKSGLFRKKKQVDDYTSLLALYPDLLKEEGKLNTERAKAIIQTEDLAAADKARLQSLIDITEEEKQALADLDKYLENTYGSLGDDLMNAIVNSVEKGTDAMEDFGKSSADVLKKLAKQMVFSLYFAKDLKDLEKQMQEIHKNNSNEEDIQNKMTEAILGFNKKIGEKTKYAENTLKDIYKGIDSQFGIESESEKERTAASKKGFASMSQDSADELNGRFTSIQSLVYEINENVRKMVGTKAINLNIGATNDKLEYTTGHQALVNNSTQMLNSIVKIQANTEKLIAIENQLIIVSKQIGQNKPADLSTLNKHLTDLNKHSRRTASELSDLRTKGLIMR